MPVVPVSPDDPRLTVYRHVRDAELLRVEGLFIAEGRFVVRRLLDGGRFTPRSLLVSPPAAADLADVIRGYPDLPCFVLPAEDFSAVAGFHVHRGCLAAAERGSELAWQDVTGPGGVLLALEGVADPDNVGSIFRHAAAFGATGILLSAGCADPLYRKAIRTSMGAALQVPYARVDALPATLHQLRERGCTVAALTLQPGATPLREARAAIGGGPVVLVLGHEGAGLSPDALAGATMQVRIPMAPGTDSLNVATAAAIALYEIRQAVG